MSQIYEGGRGSQGSRSVSNSYIAKCLVREGSKKFGPISQIVSFFYLKGIPKSFFGLFLALFGFRSSFSKVFDLMISKWQIIAVEFHIYKAYLSCDTN